MSVGPATSKHRFRLSRRDLSFLLGRLPHQIYGDPASYLEKGSKPKAAVPEGTIYTARCIRRSARSAPEAARSAAWRWSRRLRAWMRRPSGTRDMTRRFWIGSCSRCRSCTGNGRPSRRRHGFLDPTLSNWIQFAFATPVVLLGGWPFFVRGWQSLVTRNLNMFTLIAVGTAWPMSTASSGTVAPEIFPCDLPRPWRRGRRLFRIRAVITVLGLARQVLECAHARRIRRHQGPCCSSPKNRAPGSADDGADHEVKSTRLPSAIVSGPAGRKVPVDGVISKAAPRSMNRW